MYMEPIVAAKLPVSATQRRLVGSLLVLLGALVMLPWLATMAVWTAAAFSLRTLVALPRTLVQAVDYAGDRALGR